MIRWRSAFANFVGLLSLNVGAIAVLHRLGTARWAGIEWADLGTWLRLTPPADAAAALLRLVALGLAYWLLASALLYAVARGSRNAAAAGVVARFTLPMMRRVVDRFVMVAVVASAGVGPSGPAVARPAPTPSPVAIPVQTVAPAPDLPGSELAPVDEGSADSVLPRKASPTPGHPLPSDLADLPSLARDAKEGAGRTGRKREVRGETRGSSPEPSPSVEGRRSVVVQAGDNLWDLAAIRLARAWHVGRAGLTDTQIRGYWLEVIDANRRSLRSGDPNLIFPGERISLPPVREVGP